MSSIRIDPAIESAIAGFEMPEHLGFGVVMAPVMYRCDYQDGRWWDGQLLPYGALQIDPAAKVLHYAQEIFEGLKAYRVGGGDVTLFRPEMNWERMNISAQRLCMPEIPRDIFMQAVQTVSAYCQDFIPGNSGQSLYLRPFVIGTQADLSVAAANTYSFLVIASPSEVYHSGNMRVFIERNDSRAAVGGTGAVKVGGNYAASLQSLRTTRAQGYDQTLWLHPADHRHIEELSGMNFFAVIDGELHTPALSGSILPGVTRDSLLRLAGVNNMAVRQRPMAIDELLQALQSGSCSEAFACGTATIISAISALGEASGECYEIPAPGPVAQRLRTQLLDIQEGRGADDFGWVRPIDASCYP